MSLAPLILEEASLSAELIPKLASYLSNQGIQFELKKNRFKITILDQKQYESISILIDKIKKESSYFAALLHFEEVDVEDLFVERSIIAFSEVLPYLEDLDKKGICFNFLNPMPDKAYLLDALDHVKVIDEKEKELIHRMEATWGSAWLRAADSISAREWLEFTGLSTIENLLRENKDFQYNQIIEVLDYLINLDLRAEALFRELEQGDYESVTGRLNQHQKLLKAAKKSSYQELLAKARAYNESLAKKSQKHEDWQGIDLVFSFEAFSVFHLKSEFAKDRESAILRHCVGGGAYDDHPGIYSFRNKANQPLGTLEYSKLKQVIQIQGQNNGDIPSELYPAMRAFIRDYLKLNPGQINDIRNTGWRRLELIFTNPNSINGFKKQFFINAEESAINLSLKYENLNTNPNISDALLKKINNLLSINTPMLTIHTFWGQRFIPHLKIPHFDSHQSIEALFKLSERNLTSFNERTAKFIRSINQKLPKIKGAIELEELIEDILEFFEQAPAKLVNVENLAKDPKKHFKFYQELIQILQKLNPSLPLVMDEAYVEALVHESRGISLEAFLSQSSPELALVLSYLKVGSEGEGFGYGHKRSGVSVAVPEIKTKDKKLKAEQERKNQDLAELSKKIGNLVQMMNNRVLKNTTPEHIALDSILSIHKYFTESGIEPLNSFALNLAYDSKERLDPVLKQDIDFITYQIKSRFSLVDEESIKNICSDIEWEISIIEDVFQKFQTIEETQDMEDWEFQASFREAIEDLETFFRALTSKYKYIFSASLLYIQRAKILEKATMELNFLKK